MVTTLRIIAGLLGVAGLLGTYFFIHDRRQRVPGFLLFAALLCNLVGPLFHNTAIEIAVGATAMILLVASVVLYRRTPSTQ